jgi:hypothetical protein
MLRRASLAARQQFGLLYHACQGLECGACAPVPAAWSCTAAASHASFQMREGGNTPDWPRGKRLWSR